MKLIAHIHDTLLLDSDVRRMTDDRHLAHKIGVDVSRGVVQEVNHHECTVLGEHPDMGIVTGPDVAHVGTEGVAYCYVAFPNQHILTMVNEPAVLVTDRVRARIVDKYSVVPQEFLREVLRDESLAWPPVLEAEVETTLELGHQLVGIGIVLPLTVPFIAEAESSGIFPEFYA